VLRNGGPAGKVLTADEVRMLLVGWMASNAVNIWLQTRGFIGWPDDVPDVPDYQPRPSWFRFRRRTIKITESSNGEDHSSPLPDYQPGLPVSYPVQIEHQGPVPQIGYLDGNGNFIPVQLPHPVPVNRRLQ
jgi:hypothetical protein